MGSLVRRLALIAIGVAALLVPALANASDSDNEPVKRQWKGPKYLAADLQAVILAQLVPTHGFGFDGMLVVGNETFQFRAGAQIAGARGFRIGDGKVANLMEVGQADVCAAKNVYQSRVRMCVGGQAGVWQHFWKNYRVPGRKWSPWVAGTLKADYTYSLTKSFGLIFGVGVVVPAVGPSFRGTDELGRPSPVVIPGPVAGTLSLGTVIRFR